MTAFTSDVRCLNLIAFLLLLGLSTPGTAGSAKVLLYHHISSDTPPSTSITPEQFDTHLELIEAGGYEVVALPVIVDALLAGDELRSDWVAITFDDAYESVLSVAAPKLAARGWPFTVFASTDSADRGHWPYLDWNGLRSLQRQGGMVANHGRAHAHMVREQKGETRADRESRLVTEVTEAQARLAAELGSAPRLFAYPFGEFDDTLVLLLRSLDMAAFGQQSGPVGRTTNPYAIPRFPMASGFDSVESLAEKLRTEQLPLRSPEVPATVLTAETSRPVLTLALGVTLRPDSLTCFVNGAPDPDVRWLNGRTVTVRPTRPLGSGRHRITCTAPHPGMPSAYYWHTHLYMKPGPGGVWYDG